MSIRYTFTLFVFCLLTTSGVLADGDNPPEVTVDGLHRVHDTELSLVYAKPGADLSQYNRILLVKPQVAFRKNWLEAQNRIPDQRVTSEDMQRIKSELSALFTTVFKEELQNNGGYVLVEGVADDVLMVHPAIIDLDVVAPDTPGTRGARSVIASAGSMTLYMELVDSVTGDKLAQIMDNKYDRSRARPQATNRTRNEAAAKSMLGEWAKQLRMALDEARTAVGPR